MTVTPGKLVAEGLGAIGVAVATGANVEAGDGAVACVVVKGSGDVFGVPDTGASVDRALVASGIRTGAVPPLSQPERASRINDATRVTRRRATIETRTGTRRIAKNTKRVRFKAK